MYEPSDARNPQYPVFARIDGRLIPFLSPRCAIAIVVSIAVAAALWFLSGQIVHETVVDMSPSQSAEARADVKAQLNAIKLEDVEAEIASYVGEDGEPDPEIGEGGLADLRALEAERDSLASLLDGYGPDEISELARAGEAAGMDADTDEAGIEAFVPTTRVSVEPVIPSLARFSLFGIAPVASAVLLFGEFGGTSIATYIGDAVSFATRRREFEYCREEG